MKIIVSLIAMLLLASCSSKKAREEVRQEVAAETQVSDAKSLGKSIEEVINGSQHLTAAQKAELHKILAENKATAMKLQEESYKLRSVLIKELLGKLNRKHVKIIKKDIKKVEAARLKNTFDTVEKISAIVANHPENQQFADHLIYMEGAGSRGR